MSDKSEARAFFEKVAEVMPGNCEIREVDPVEEDGVEGEWIQFTYGGSRIRAEIDNENLVLNVVQMPIKVSFSALPETLTLGKIPVADPTLFERIPRVLEGFVNMNIDEEIKTQEEKLERLEKIRSIVSLKEKLEAYFGGAK